MAIHNVDHVEVVLRNYYLKLNEIKKRKQFLCAINQNINDFKRTLLHVYELIPIRETTSTYKAIWGAYCVNDLTAKRYFEFSSTMEQFKNYLTELTHRQQKLKIQILYLESEIEGITFALSILEPSDRIICEKCYGIQGKSNIQIGNDLKMDEKTIRYRRKKILAQLLKIIRLYRNYTIITEQFGGCSFLNTGDKNSRK